MNKDIKKMLLEIEKKRVEVAKAEARIEYLLEAIQQKKYDLFDEKQSKFLNKIK